MDWFVATLTTLWQQYSGLGISLAGLAVITSKYWTPYLSKLPLPSFKKSDAVDPKADISDVEALHLLQARAKRSKCPVLQKAVRDLEVAFVNHAEAQSAEVAKCR